jgi:cyclin-dependent kinase-like
MDQLYLIQKVLGHLTPEQQESFNSNPRFNGLKFPDLTKPETLEKRYMSSLSKKALSLMVGLLSMDPAYRLTGEQALQHPWFDDIRNPEEDAILLNMIATV